MSTINQLINDNELPLYLIDSYSVKSTSKVISISNNEDSTSTVILENSILYPEGGGQPCDLGLIDGIPIIDVQKYQNSSTNINTSIIVKLSNILDSNKSVVDCEVDWSRRYDFMQQHTAQHLLSALADKIFNAETVGWSLGSDYVTVDIQPKELLNIQQINRLEYEINKEIRAGTIISSKIYNKQELNSLSYLRGLPKGAAENLLELRIVDIIGLDQNPCGGTHLKSLNEIQLLKIVSFENDKNIQKLKFISGNRVLNYLSSTIARETQLSQLISAPPDQHIDTINKLYNDKKLLNKQIKYLTDELIINTSNSMISYFKNSDNKYLVYYKIGLDVNTLLSIADLVLSVYPDKILYISSDNNIANMKVDNKKKLQLTVIDFNSNYNIKTNNTTGVFVLAGPVTVIEPIKAQVFEIINGRGGGRPGRIQGTANNIENIENIKQFLISNTI